MRRKIVGSILVVAGLLLFIIAGAAYLRRGSEVVSPVPDDRGVKVIYK
ncbi:MAG: hypothetical protein UZ22_OP11002000816 [Microgenomates bacterium OLB23]|nr:MAG: hypothetical protein UZ22_OP11002000816 [Microgenomates bacterium OLB23]